MPEKKRETEVPQHVINSLARCILPEIQAYFESEKGKMEFAKWKEKQQLKRKGA